ncbi:MAG TPA: hypothetical protein ENI07_08750 [Desulfobacterales bacterium]|nr:hypothetical protein [Desulfobacterales bacterium]
MSKCMYCEKTAITMDAIGLDACLEHENNADEYFESRTGRKPNEDPFLHCKDHGDMWVPECKRCEECSQHHYGHDVTRLLERFKTGELGIKIYEINDIIKKEETP